MIKWFMMASFLLLSACSNTIRPISDVVTKTSVTLNNFCAGVLVGPHTILTAAHCVYDDKKGVITDKQVYVKVQGKWIIAKPHIVDPHKDLALLEIPGGHFTDWIEIANVPAQIGDAIWCIGNPGGDLNDWLSAGIVSRLDQQDHFVDEKYDTDITCTIHGGNSGGALVNANGELLGIIVSALSQYDIYGRPSQFGSNYTSAINLKTVKEFLENNAWE